MRRATLLLLVCVMAVPLLLWTAGHGRPQQPSASDKGEVGPSHSSQPDKAWRSTVSLTEGIVGGYVPPHVRKQIYIDYWEKEHKGSVFVMRQTTRRDVKTYSFGELLQDDWQKLMRLLTTERLWSLPKEIPSCGDDIYRMDTSVAARVGLRYWENCGPASCIRIPSAVKPTAEEVGRFKSVVKGIKAMAEKVARHPSKEADFLLAQTRNSQTGSANPLDTARPSNAGDQAFARYFDADGLGRAWADLNSADLTDAALQLANGERVLLRPHHELPAEGLLEVAMKVALEKRDQTSLDRLRRAAQREKNSAFVKKIEAASKLVGEARASAGAFTVAVDSMTATEFSRYREHLTTIQSATIAGDRQSLDALVEEPRLLKGIPETQQLTLARLADEKQAALTQGWNPAPTVLMLNRLSASSRMADRYSLVHLANNTSIPIRFFYRLAGEDWPTTTITIPPGRGHYFEYALDAQQQDPYPASEVRFDSDLRVGRDHWLQYTLERRKVQFQGDWTNGRRYAFITQHNGEYLDLVSIN